jgi:PTS system mannitol-specific IIC component
MAIEDIPDDAEIVITHESLTNSAKQKAKNAEHISVKDFVDNKSYDEIVKYLKNSYEFKAIEEDSDSEDELPLRKRNIVLGLKSMNKYDAIRMAGEMLVKGGYVDTEYIAAMIEREDDLTTYIGKGIAIPHGVGNAKKNIRKSGMVVLQFPDGIAFGDDTAYLVIGIAGVGNEHLSILSNIATVIDEEDVKTIELLFNTKDVKFIYNLFTKNAN